MIYYVWECLDHYDLVNLQERYQFEYFGPYPLRINKLATKSPLSALDKDYLLVAIL